MARSRTPRLMLTKRYKSHAAAQKASQTWADKLGVSVGAKGPAVRGPAKKKSASKRKNSARTRGPQRNKHGRFVKRGRSRR